MTDDRLHHPGRIYLAPERCIFHKGQLVLWKGDRLRPVTVMQEWIHIRTMRHCVHVSSARATGRPLQFTFSPDQLMPICGVRCETI